MPFATARERIVASEEAAAADFLAAYIHPMAKACGAPLSLDSLTLDGNPVHDLQNGTEYEIVAMWEVSDADYQQLRSELKDRFS